MATMADLADRVERLLLRHEELKRTNDLLLAQVQATGHERDSLKSRLAAARARIDALLQRIPVDESRMSTIEAQELEIDRSAS